MKEYHPGKSEQDTTTDRRLDAVKKTAVRSALRCRGFFILRLSSSAQQPFVF
jgi:hypothetical protein